MKGKAKTRLWSKWIASLGAAVALIVVFACNSPFIPIPPPDPTFSESASPEQPGQWAVSSGPDSRAANALFFIYNASSGSGLIQRAADDGAMYAYPLYGRVGDRIHIHWEHPNGRSSSTICRPLGTGLIRQGCQ